MLSLLMIYLVTGAIFCIYQGAQVGGASFRVMVFGTLITYGVYIVSSILALDPWHILIVSGTSRTYSDMVLT
jgi:chitin synthase